ncbi:HAD-IA family hydrolase [Candidatus Woesearchaeota archaeon]|nr:HAD-IA family hydrolase [Candidatus Woesearchaeota archaeon]
MKIDTIISDLGGVLVEVDKAAMARLLAKYSSLPFEEINRHFSNRILTDIDIEFGKGLLTPEEFYSRVTSQLKITGLSFEMFRKIYCEIFRRKEEVIAFLRRLSSRCTVALLSNTDALHMESWAALLGEDMKMFRQLILSFQVHKAKPDREIFLEATRKLNVVPQQCAFIDDKQEYADAAGKAGMCGIRFVSLQQLESDLAKLGVSA